MFIDTHAHLWWDSYGDELQSVIARAESAKVLKMIVPGTQVESSLASIKLAKKYPEKIFAAVGVHPEETLGELKFEISELEKMIVDNREWIRAIGEIGIDLFTEEMQQKLEEQKELFKEQLELAVKYDLSVIIHTRNSFDEAWEVLNSLPTLPRGQFHCFSVDEEAVVKVLAAGFYVSFAGNITWSKRVGRLVPLVPDNRLLLETDSPLMVPRDADGKPIGGTERNEPANVAYLAQKIAELRGQKVEEVEKYTTENVNTLYKL